MKEVDAELKNALDSKTEELRSLQADPEYKSFVDQFENQFQVFNEAKAKHNYYDSVYDAGEGVVKGPFKIVSDLDANPSEKVRKQFANEEWNCGTTRSFDRILGNGAFGMTNKGDFLGYKLFERLFGARRLFRNPLCNDKDATFQHYALNGSGAERLFMRDMGTSFKPGEINGKTINADDVFSITEMTKEGAVIKFMILCGGAKHKNDASSENAKKYEIC